MVGTVMTGAFGKPLFEIVVFRLAFSQSDPPAVIMDHDGDVIRVVEGRRGAIERGIIEVPFRRSELPNQLRKIVPVFVVALPAAFGGKIILVPPLELGLWRQRYLAGFLAADQITAHRDEGLAALGPERRDDVGRPRSPIKTGDDRLLDFESIHQGDDIDGERRLLAIADRVTGEKSCRAVAAQIRDDHPVARLRQQRRNIGIAVNVVGPAVEKNDRRTIGGTGFGISNIEDAGIDLLERAETRCSSPAWLQALSVLSCWIVRPQSRSCRAGRRQWSRRQCPENGGDES